MFMYYYYYYFLHFIVFVYYSKTDGVDAAREGSVCGVVH